MSSSSTSVAEAKPTRRSTSRPSSASSASYQLKFTLDGDRVGAFITLRQHDEVVFTASFTGRAVPLTPARLVTSAVRQPLMPLRVAALIRVHGVWLWMRRLPVVRRIPQQGQAGR